MRRHALWLTMLVLIVVLGVVMWQVTDNRGAGLAVVAGGLAGYVMGIDDGRRYL